MNRRQLLSTTGLGLLAGAVAHAGILPASAADVKSQPGDAKAATQAAGPCRL